MKLTAEEAREVVWGDTYEWESASSKETLDTSRWSYLVRQIFKHTLTNKFYEFYWSVGATEQQEERPFEDEDFYSPQEVIEKEVVTKQWVKV